jgi:hypothetical protein
MDVVCVLCVYVCAMCVCVYVCAMCVCAHTHIGFESFVCWLTLYALCSMLSMLYMLCIMLTEAYSLSV